MRWVLALSIILISGCGSNTWRIHGKVEWKARAEYDLQKGRAAVKQTDTHTESVQEQ